MAKPNTPHLLARLGQSLEVRMLALALAIGALLSLASPNFLTATNIFNLLDQSVVIGLVAIGMTFVVLTGGIDLSVGSVAGLTGIVLGLAAQTLPLPVAVGAAVLVGAGLGLISGVLVAIGGLAPFVVTLGMMAIGRSLAYVVSGQSVIASIPDSLSVIVFETLWGIPVNVLFLLAMYALAWLYLARSKGGRTIYAVGSNREAAYAAGLRVRWYSILPYAVCSAFAAIAVTFSIAQIGSADPLAGNLWELDAIAAVVIGGCSLFGGRGSIIGTLLGVFIMVMIRNGLNLMGISAYWQGTAIGSIIIVALLIERLLSRRTQH